MHFIKIEDGTYSNFGHKKKKSTETVVGRSPPDHNEKFPEPHSHHALQPKFVAIQTGRSERTLPSTFDCRESRRKQLPTICHTKQNKKSSL